MPLDDEYLSWLYTQVGGSVDNQNLAQTHWNLLRLLYKTQFEWSIPKDENRAHDGTDFRYQFLRERGKRIGSREKHWMAEPCSMLELIYGLAFKLAFESMEEGATPDRYFWELLDNIGLRQCTDADPPDPVIVEIILNKIIDRDYAPNGAGGLFPLNHAETDQRDVELWYQAQAYLLERL